MPKVKKIKVSKKKSVFAKKVIEEGQKKDDVMLSVIIPAYKEEKRIGNTLLSLDKYLSPLGFNYEIIVVIDG